MQPQKNSTESCPHPSSTQSSNPTPSSDTIAPRNTSLRNTKTMVHCSFLIALSILLTHVLTISTPILRFNLGGVPILLAGVLYGPLGGCVVGMLSDLIGGTLAGYSINPMITVGTSLTGLLMGCCYHYLPLKKLHWKLLSGVVWGNLIGSVIVNSLALRIYYGYAWAVLAARIPNNLIVGTIEFLILCYICKNKGLMRQLTKR